MGEYRIWLLNGAERVVAHDEFVAAGDAEATRMAVVLVNACADAFGGFALWRGDREIAARRAPVFDVIVKRIADRMDDATRAEIAARAERIRRGRKLRSQAPRHDAPPVRTFASIEVPLPDRGPATAHAADSTSRVCSSVRW